MFEEKPISVKLKTNSEVREIIRSQIISTIESNYKCTNSEFEIYSLIPGSFEIKVTVPSSVTHLECRELENLRILKNIMRGLYSHINLAGINEIKPFDIIRHLGTVPPINFSKRPLLIDGKMVIAIYGNQAFLITMYLKAYESGDTSLVVEYEPLIKDKQYSSFCPITPKLLRRHVHNVNKSRKERSEVMSVLNQSCEVDPQGIAYNLRWNDYLITFDVSEYYKHPLEYVDYDSYMMGEIVPIEHVINRELPAVCIFTVRNVKIYKVKSDLGLYERDNNLIYDNPLDTPVCSESLLGWWHVMLRDSNMQYRISNRNTFYFDEVY